ncbi:hypothetical protein [Chengkuizengella marina]|uniref:hypothetical protein n=1 Tax=Chengkuizengella marina TaxID=2507566 RepID=UPI0013719C04|nr:hypothetical protein [Chengkuizengella marina]
MDENIIKLKFRVINRISNFSLLKEIDSYQKDEILAFANVIEAKAKEIKEILK